MEKFECFANTINLVVTDALGRVQLIKCVIKKARDIGTFFRRSNFYSRDERQVVLYTDEQMQRVYNNYRQAKSTTADVNKEEFDVLFGLLLFSAVCTNSVHI